MIYGYPYEFDLIRNILDNFFEIGDTRINTARCPSNIYENNAGYMIQIYAPGMNKDDISVSSDNGILKVNLKRVNKIDEKLKVLRNEIKDYEETISYNIPEEADVNNIEAKYNNGILMIFLPKKNKTEPKKISVKIN